MKLLATSGRLSVAGLARIGYLAKGLIFVAVGILALMALFGFAEGRVTGSEGAIHRVGRELPGRLGFGLLAVGLGAHVFWRLYQAFIDPDERGMGLRGMIARIGLLCSAGLYSSLLLVTLSAVTDLASMERSGEAAAVALEWPGGRWLLGLIGAGVNAIGMGLGPQMTREMDGETKSRFGVLAYLIGLLKAFRRQPRFKATIRVNSHEHTHQCVQITVANGIHYGGGMIISDDAQLDDGQLDVVIVQHQSRLSLLGNADSLRWGQTRNADNIIHLRCKEIEIDTDPKLEVTADGEFLLNTPVHCRIEHAALHVFAPEEPA